MAEISYFKYGKEETDYLCARDSRLADVIEKVGAIQREVRPDLFDALIHSIVGQQISTKAHATISQRIESRFGVLNPQNVSKLSNEELQSVGLTFRKVSYMKEAARRILAGELDLESLRDMPDNEVCRALSSLPGVGVWTAEMLMTFSMQRPNIISYGDLAIVRGLRMIYRHRCITPQLFEKYRRRYSPYCTVASLYLWAVAGGAIPELRDLAPKSKPKIKKLS